MRNPIQGSWYASRRVSKPVAVTAAALDRITGHEVIPCALPQASLGRALAPAGESPLSGPVRRLRGTLRLRGLGGTVPVEVELQAWSRQETEVGVRPAGARPPTWRADRYFASVAALLDDLSACLVAAVGDRDRAERLPRAS